MIQKVKKRIGMMTFLVVTATLLLACGGGSSSDDSNGPGGDVVGPGQVGLLEIMG